MIVGKCLRVQSGEADGNSQAQKVFYSCCGAGAKMEKLRGREEPQTYLKARFSIMSLNEMSAYKGRADKYGRVMVLGNNRAEGGGLLIKLLIIWRL